MAQFQLPSNGMQSIPFLRPAEWPIGERIACLSYTIDH